MALLGHLTPQMTLRYAKLASPQIRAAYDDAMVKVKARRALPLMLSARSIAMRDRGEWLRQEMLKTPVAHEHCCRHLAAGACPYANICDATTSFTATAH